MSCHWDVYCADCEESTHMDDTNHKEELCAWLAANAKRLREFASLFRTSPWSEAELKLDFTHIPLSFFEKHGDHRVFAQDEYGEFSGKCGVRFKCLGGCGHTSYCALPNGHGGEHGAKP